MSREMEGVESPRDGPLAVKIHTILSVDTLIVAILL